MILQWFKRKFQKKQLAVSASCAIIPRKEHGISRQGIAENALKVLYRLHKKGYQAYLVGGGIRDLLLKVPPKDFDIVTNATPDQIRHLFRNCRLIGRRFRLAHVFFGKDIIEVATFRSAHETSGTDMAHQSDAGVLLRDNVYGKTIEEDVRRRDFTLNALYYNIADFSIVDCVGGLKDIQERTLRLIGDPDTRYREDPVRMLRAIRFAAQRNLHLHPDTEQPIADLASLLTHVAAARLFEELHKLFLKGKSIETFHALQKSGLFPYLFPSVTQAINTRSECLPLIEAVLKSTDERLIQGKPVILAFVLCGLLWWPILQRKKSHYAHEKGLAGFEYAMEDIWKEQNKVIHIPRRIQEMCTEIWLFQARLVSTRLARADVLVTEPRFRAAYDFLCLRADSGEKVHGAAQFWTAFQATEDPHLREKLKKQFTHPHPNPPPRGGGGDKHR
jgi:poly(A) polymerase